MTLVEAKAYLLANATMYQVEATIGPDGYPEIGSPCFVTWYEGEVGYKHDDIIAKGRFHFGAKDVGGDYGEVQIWASGCCGRSAPEGTFTGSDALELRDIGEQYVCPSCKVAWADGFFLICHCEPPSPWDHGRNPARGCDNMTCQKCGWKGRLPDPARPGIEHWPGWGSRSVTIEGGHLASVKNVWPVT